MQGLLILLGMHSWQVECRCGCIDVPCDCRATCRMCCDVLCCDVMCCAVPFVQMNVSDVEAELQRAMQLQSSTAAALKEAVQDKLKAEADLKKVMVSTISVKGMFWGNR